MGRVAVIISVLFFVFLSSHCSDIDEFAPGTKQFYYLLSRKELILDQLFLISMYTKGVHASTSTNPEQASDAFQLVIQPQVTAINKAIDELNGTNAQRCTGCLQSQVDNIVQTVGQDIVKCLHPLATSTMQLDKSLVPIRDELMQNYNFFKIKSCDRKEDREAKYECILSFLADMYDFVANKTALVSDKTNLVEVLLLTDVVKCFSRPASIGVNAVNVLTSGLNACINAAGVAFRLPVFPEFVDKLVPVMEDARVRFNRKGLAAISEKFIKEEEQLKILLSQAQTITNEKAESIVLSVFNDTLNEIKNVSAVVFKTQYAWCCQNAQAQLRSIMSRVKDDLIICAKDIISKVNYLQMKLDDTKSNMKEHLAKNGFHSIVLCLINDTSLFIRSDINVCSQNVLNNNLKVKEDAVEELDSLEEEIDALNSDVNSCQNRVIQALNRAENILQSLKQCGRIK